MKKKKLWMLALTVVLLILTFTVNAFGAPSVVSGDYKYVVQDDDTVKIIAYLGKETTVNIPSEIDGKTVSSLGFGLFSSSIKTHTVVVPDCVVSMDGVLAMSGVKNVRIGAGVEKIRSNEFYSVEKISVSENNPNFASVDGVLYDNAKKKLICVPTGREYDTFRIPEGVEVIGDNAIVDVSMSSLVIPSTVKHIGRNAISLSGIKSLVIPSSVESLSMYAIYQCNGLKTLKFENGNLKTIDSHVVEECENLTTVSIPANVESIGRFYSCPSLKKIIVSGANKKYTTVDGVLYNKEMTKLIWYPAAKSDEIYTVPDSTTVICDAAFCNVGNLSLKKLYIHKGMTEFEYDAFIYSGGFEICYEGTQEEFDAITNAYIVKQAVSSVKYNNYIYRPVENLKAKTNGTSITLTWDKVNFVTGYRVFVKTSAGWKTLATLQNNTYTAKNLTLGTKYTFAVRSYTETDGKKVWAPEYTTVKTLTKPGVTSKLKFSYDSTWIKLLWNKVPGATGYRIYVYDKGWKAVKTTTGTSYVVNNLKSGTKYTFAVRAYTKFDGATYWASSYKKLETATTPGTTKAVTASKISSEYITLKWNSVQGATGYRVYVWNTQTKKWDTAVRATTKLTATVKNLVPGRSYIFAVKAYTKAGSSYVWAKTYTKLTTRTGDMTDDYARKLFCEASKIDARWWPAFYVVKGYESELPATVLEYTHIIDTDDVIYTTYDGETYYYYAVIDDEIKSTEDLRALFGQYFDEEYVEHCLYDFVDYKGQLYISAYDFDYETATYYTDSIKKISATHYRYYLNAHYEDGDEGDIDRMYYDLIYKNGKWVFTVKYEGERYNGEKADDVNYFYPVVYADRLIKD